MDLEDQAMIMQIAKEHGDENLIIVLGQPDADSTELTAETVTLGDPSYAGPLAGVSLGLPVYHILEDVIKSQVDPETYEREVGLMALTLEVAPILEGLSRVRNAAP